MLGVDPFVPYGARVSVLSCVAWEEGILCAGWHEEGGLRETDICIKFSFSIVCIGIRLSTTKSKFNIYSQLYLLPKSILLLPKPSIPSQINTILNPV